MGLFVSDYNTFNIMYVMNIICDFFPLVLHDNYSHFDQKIKSSLVINNKIQIFERLENLVFVMNHTILFH